MKTYQQFISFEGIDFCGKSTQVQRLLERLRQRSLPVHLLREPGGTMISEKIRTILLDTAHRELHDRSEILLYSAARAQLVHEKLLPLLETGDYVIVDRFFDSTTVYQGYGRGLDVAFVDSLNRFATSGLIPYKTFLIDISPAEALRRRAGAERQSDRLENESGRFYQIIYDGYQELRRRFPGRFVVIPGERPVDEIAEDIWKKILALWDI